MHIVFVSAFFIDNKYIPLSGMPGYIYKIANYLQKRGHLIEIVAGASNNKKWNYKGVIVHNVLWEGRLSGTWLNVSKSIITREFRLQKELHKINKNNPIDIVQYAGWSGIGSMHSLNCPSVLRLSTYSKIQYVENEVFKSDINVYSYWERMAGKRADGVISPSKIMANRFGNDILKNVTIIETPYSDNVIVNDSTYLKKLKDIKYMLYYGTFSRDKGFEVIGDMLVDFFNQNNDIQFVCAGWDVKTDSGSAVQIMKKKLGNKANRIIYLGLLQKEQLFPVIAHAEFVLIPSLMDNLPNACLEALSMNRIVIGTYGTSLEQMIINGVNGFLSKPGDANSLLEAVQRVCNLTENEKEQMKINNKKIVRKFSPDKVVDKLERYYYWVLKNWTIKRTLLKQKNIILKKTQQI